MSMIQAFETSLNDFSREQYTQYLENQLQRISSFMLFQKKENQKTHQLMHLIQEQNQKIKFMNDKIQLLEIYQNQNFKHQQKLLNSVEKVDTLAKKIEKMQLNQTYQEIYQSSNKSSEKKNHQQLKREISSEFEYKFLQLQDKINSVERSLIKKVHSVLQKFSNELPLINKKLQAEKKIKCSKNETPQQTNYTENTSSRLRQIDTSQLSQKNHIPNRDKKVSSFVNQRLDNLQKELKFLQHSKNMDNSINNLTDRTYKQKNPTSPISSYLKIQNQFESQRSKNNFFPQTRQKPFYSVLQKQKDPIKKSKNKRKRSKSKSQNISQRSFSESNISNKAKSKKSFKNQSKFIEQVSSKKFSNIKNLVNLPQKIDNKIKNNKSLKKQHKKLNASHHSIIKQQDKRIEKISKQSQKKEVNKEQFSRKKKQRKSDRSSFSLSQKSIRSGSFTNSKEKKFKNQKEYLMNCNKFHD